MTQRLSRVERLNSRLFEFESAEYDAIEFTTVTTVTSTSEVGGLYLMARLKMLIQRPRKRQPQSELKFLLL